MTPKNANDTIIKMTDYFARHKTLSWDTLSLPTMLVLMKKIPSETKPVEAIKMMPVEVPKNAVEMLPGVIELIEIVYIAWAPVRMILKEIAALKLPGEGFLVDVFTETVPLQVTMEITSLEASMETTSLKISMETSPVALLIMLEETFVEMVPKEIPAKMMPMTAFVETVPTMHIGKMSMEAVMKVTMDVPAKTVPIETFMEKSVH